MELTFGEQIKIMLKRKNMTIRQLAELVEVQTGKPMSRQNLTQKLNRDNFQEQDMKEIAQALGCAVKISVIDQAEPSAQGAAAAQAAEPVRERRPADGRETAAAAEKGGRRAAERHSVGRLRAGRHGGHGTELAERKAPAQAGASELAREEAAVTRQPFSEEEAAGPAPGSGVEDDVNADVLKEIELALMESVQKQMGFGQESAKTAGRQEETQQENEQEPGVDTLAWASKKPLVWPTLTVPTVPGKKTEGPEPEAERPEEEPAGIPEAGELPFEEGPLPVLEDLEDIPMTQEEADGLEDLEFFDLEDFNEEEIFQVSAPYVMKREKEEAAEKPQDKEKSFKKEKSFRKERRIRRKELSEEPAGPEEVRESGGFDRISEGEGDVSFASAPYVISREPEKAPEEGEAEESAAAEAGIIKEETAEEGSGEALPSGQKAPPEERPFPVQTGEPEETGEEAGEPGKPGARMGSFSGSRGDISSVSAPYVIPREPEEKASQRPMEKAGARQEAEASEGDDWAALSPEELAEEPGEEEALSPDLEEKIASWDAAVKRQLENPFLRALEGRRARREEKARESGAEKRPGGREKPEPKLRVVSDARTETEAESRPQREEEEIPDLQGPALDPVTGKEYETNTVKHHPSKPDMLLVYDQDEHRWIVQAERAFLNFQINKRALLGKDYEPPVYLD